MNPAMAEEEFLMQKFDGRPLLTLIAQTINLTNTWDDVGFGIRSFPGFGKGGAHWCIYYWKDLHEFGEYLWKWMRWRGLSEGLEVVAERLGVAEQQLSREKLCVLCRILYL